MARRYRTRRKTRFKRRMKLYIRFGMFILVVLLIALLGMKIFKLGSFSDAEKDDGFYAHVQQPDMKVELLTVNPYSRPGTKSGKIKNIVIHYTANPGTSAKQNRNYFENLKDSKERKASSHFVIGLDGEIIQCIPTWEIAYASNERNYDTISIETCHQDESGIYTEETYQSLIQLTAWLCEKNRLTEEDVIRHYDITKKICPKYFVEDEDAWNQFKLDVKKVLKE